MAFYIAPAVSLARLIVRVFDDNRNGGIDWDEFKWLHEGIKTLQDKLAGLHAEHAAAGRSPAAPAGGAPGAADFYFTREDLAAFLEVYFGERGPAARQLAVESAPWTDAPDQVPRLHFPGALRLVVQLFGLQKSRASEEEARRFFSLCG
jgi:hypothetical protein